MNTTPRALLLNSAVVLQVLCLAWIVRSGSWGAVWVLCLFPCFIAMVDDS